MGVKSTIQCSRPERTFGRKKSHETKSETKKSIGIIKKKVGE